jgi:hypothetical protein
MMRKALFSGDGSTLSLDFTTGVLDSRLTFTRSTTGTYINSSGYVTSAAIDAPRFNYNSTGTLLGLLIEGSATNLALRSGDFNTTVTDGTNWIASGYTAGTLSTTLPDGTTGDARRISFASGSGSFRSSTITVTASTAYTFSFWARNNGGSQARFRVWNATVGSPIVDYTESVNNYVSQIGGADNTSSTWVRVSKQFTTPPGCTAIYVYPCSSDSGTVDLLIWGAQVEAGSVSSYIPTVASTGFRAVDTAIIAAGANFDSWYTGGTTGTFVANWYANAASSTARTVIATNDETNKHLHMYQTASALTLRLADFNAAATVTTANSMTAGALTKGAFSYASTATNLCLNGGTVASGTLAFSSAPTWLSIGAPSTNGTSITGTTVVLNNSIRSIKYWPSVLSNTTLQALTT